MFLSEKSKKVCEMSCHWKTNVGASLLLGNDFPTAHWITKILADNLTMTGENLRNTSASRTVYFCRCIHATLYLSFKWLLLAVVFVSCLLFLISGTLVLLCRTRSKAKTSSVRPSRKQFTKVKLIPSYLQVLEVLSCLVCSIFTK